MKKKRGRFGLISQLVNADIGIVIFFIILIYMFSSIVLYLTSKKTEVYEVCMGSLSDNITYRGIALRSETLVNSRYMGYVNYYYKETDHIAYGGLAYSVDENGEIADYADANMKSGDYFRQSDLETFRRQTRQFTEEFDPDRFYAIYDYKSISSSQAQKISNRAILAGIKNLDSTSIHTVSATSNGAILYSYDNYNNRSFEELTAKDFDSSRCRKVRLQNGQKIKKGKPVCRIVTEENWSIAIPVEDEEAAKKLQDEDYVEVRFLKNNYRSWAQVSTRQSEDGQWMANLTFSNSMEAFASDRFVDIEIQSNEERGLKVPNSAITTGEFFLVPKEYVFEGTNGQLGVLLSVYTGSSSNSQGTRFIPAVPYSETDQEYYIDNSVLRDGEIIERPNSTDQYTLGKKETLIGVYYINKGYPDFRQVHVIMENNDYSIVTPNELYGLQEHDYIVLHADSIRFNNY
jgi:hypothetical protein